jgi:hypothetical protein
MEETCPHRACLFPSDMSSQCSIGLSGICRNADLKPRFIRSTFRPAWTIRHITLSCDPYAISPYSGESHHRQMRPLDRIDRISFAILFGFHRFSLGRGQLVSNNRGPKVMLIRGSVPWPVPTESLYQSSPNVCKLAEVRLSRHISTSIGPS